MDELQSRMEAVKDNLAAFAKTLTQREKKEMQKKMDGPEDEVGGTVALLWLAMRRNDPKVAFDPLLDYTDEELVAGYEQHVPLVPKN